MSKSPAELYVESVEKVNEFLHRNYPCGCRPGVCEQETHESAEVVRIVLDTYGIGLHDG